MTGIETRRGNLLRRILALSIYLVIKPTSYRCKTYSNAAVLLASIQQTYALSRVEPSPVSASILTTLLLLTAHDTLAEEFTDAATKQNFQRHVHNTNNRTATGQGYTFVGKLLGRFIFELGPHF